MTHGAGRSLMTAAFLAAALPALASAATIYLEPDAGTYGPGDTFILNVRLDTAGECYNAADVTVTYPVNSLRATDFSRGNSIFTLWIEDPKIDTEAGIVHLQGGTPGGYCGRIKGDPSMSNVLGKIIFSVIDSGAGEAAVNVSKESRVYLNDGLGTPSEPETVGAKIVLAESRVTTDDAWLGEVRDDTTPPEPFAIEVESTRGVFGGKYYAVFSTTDKQSGMDHFEISEHGAWKPVMSPYQLRESVSLGVHVRAIDKAGNIRLGTYIEGSAPPRQYSVEDTMYTAIAVIVVLLVVAYEIYRRRKHALAQDVQAS